MVSVLLLVIYVGAHLTLSRVSARLVERELGKGGFLYVPVDIKTLTAHQTSLMRVHWSFCPHGSWTPVWVDHSPFIISSALAMRYHGT